MRFALAVAGRPAGLGRVLSELVGRSRHDWTVLRDPAEAAATGACAVLTAGEAAAGGDPSTGLPRVALVGGDGRSLLPGQPGPADTSLTAAAHVLAVTPGAHDALAALLPGRVELLRPGLDPLPPALPPSWPRGGLLLAAGPLVEASRHAVAVDAYRQAVTAGFRGRLVVTGTSAPGSPALVAALRDRAAGVDVTVLPDPGPAVLHALLGTATAFLAPALVDVGAPVREALALGTPVLAAASGPDRGTVAHDRTGWLLAPDARALAHQALMVGVCTPVDLAPMRAACTAAAADWTWEAVVRRLDDVVELVGLGLPVSAAQPQARSLAGSLMPRQASTSGRTGS